MNHIDPDAPILTIAAAAELAKMHPQTLRQYDRMGLVRPSRTIGQSRRYTLRNVTQLVEVAKLSSEGVSLVAIKRILDLENYVATGATTTAMTVEATVTGNTASGTVESGQITATVLP